MRQPRPRNETDDKAASPETRRSDAGPGARAFEPALGPEAPAPPRHVAIIMDGNGRWAQDRGWPRALGHREGARTVREVVTACREIGVRYLTLYAFSSENWGRPSLEVRALMELCSRFLVNERPTLTRNGIELCAIGDLDRLPRRVRARLDETMRLTAGLDGMRLTLALSYGGRDEVVRAVRALAREVAAGELDPEAIGEHALARRLDTAGTPDPDLVIRTGGEHRLSNFLLWQAAYAELFVTDTRWPAFERTELESILAWYQGRTRRFGLVTPAADSRRRDASRRPHTSGEGEDAAP